MNALFKRRSIRKYKKDRPVEKEKVRKILEAGFAAPSARNTQPYNFLVIDKRELLDSIPDAHPYAEMSREATLAVLVLGELEKQPNKGYIAQDLSAATENILIEATELGLGSVWLGVYPRGERMKNLKELFNIPDRFIPFSLIIIGYPDEKKPPSDRYSDEKVFYNKF
ncbi:MAG: nitroreductase family protein [candidate division WOR-3 bacterium]|nr:nitroreductase family protein [candidate division WOR-3 bacterium]